MHSLGGELLILGVLFVLAWGLGRLGKLIGLPAIPIYMVVGVLASPNTHFFPLAFEPADVELVATFGLIFLLFNLGLEFDQEEFFGNAGKLVLSGGVRIVINIGAGFAFGLWVGWGTREALIIAGMTAVSSSAIVTKLLIELRRLANRETPMILGIAVLEDIFVAAYLAIVGVVVGGETDLGAIVLKLLVSFGFLVVMFAVARWGGKVVSRIVQTRDDELFTILFFGLAVAFGGIGELLGVSDAIGAFLIGLVLGATRFRQRIEQFALPMRDVFAAFFFLNFGLALDVREFGSVLVPVIVAVVMTLIINTASGQLIARFNKLTPAEGLNASAMLQNRGEFALILATLAAGAGLDERLTPFAGLYVLIMAVVGPILSVNSEKIGGAIFRRRSVAARRPDAGRDLELAIAEAAMEDPRSGTRDGGDAAEPTIDGRYIDDDGTAPVETPRAVTVAEAEEAAGSSQVDDPDFGDDDLDDRPRRDGDRDRQDALRLAEQAMLQSDGDGPVRRRERDPEY
ncbi:cation:proton antiporter [Schumannella sp. 10F1B-5-1]|uniref:cation:proton antiporter n=1 Tax=Schumannella sp. 10F1B-5-1 TaxID=2590780 RepID=UPI0011300B8C|nr:cation:proton antiporter [Schumannella sp. 10F1B-5-1]TPW71788.1 cation:proton antiporter [Schumannella sp. 10F1B-5-1]